MPFSFEKYLVKFHINRNSVKVLNMSFSFWLLRLKLHDFFQAEKERIAYNAEQIHK